MLLKKALLRGNNAGLVYMLPLTEPFVDANASHRALKALSVCVCVRSVVMIYSYVVAARQDVIGCIVLIRGQDLHSL